MKNTILMVFLGVLCYGVNAQNTLQGVVIDADTELPLKQVQIKILHGTFSTQSNLFGVFTLQNFPKGKSFVSVSLQGYETQKYSLNFNGKPIDLGTIKLYKLQIVHKELQSILLSEDELSTDDNAADNITGLLQATKDTYLKTAAYEFSSSFYKVRGLGSEYGLVLINGIELNKIINNRPLWSNWGGLNHITNNQEFFAGLHTSTHNFGSILGTTQINTFPTNARPGTKISFTSSNRSYKNRILVSYTSGLLKSGWNFSFAASKRTAKEGFVEGTHYKSNSFFASIEKKINKNHRIVFSGIFTPNYRGKSSANTEEVYQLKGIDYNSYWGFQNGKIRNSRVKKVVEPILIFNHQWTINSTTKLQTNIGYQFGQIGNSRIDYLGNKIDGTLHNIPVIVSLGGSNPDPSYYQNLPSFGLMKKYSNVYEMQETFKNNGQIDWNSMYTANKHVFNNGLSTYIIYEDRTDDKQLHLSTLLTKTFSEKIALNASFQLKQLRSENYAKVLDLLGGKGFLDIDAFASNNIRKQSNLFEPNRIVVKGEDFKYNYSLRAKVLKSFIQIQLRYPRFDGFLAGAFATTQYQRIGNYHNGKFNIMEESYGKSKLQQFASFGLKIGGTYKITGRHLLNFTSAFLTKPPSLGHTFSNIRISNHLINPALKQKIKSFDVSYVFRSSSIKSKITAYYTKIKDATEISYYFANGIDGDGLENAAFVQEILTGIDKKHIGVEIGIEAQVLPDIKLRAVAAIGQYRFDNNPLLTLTSEKETFQFDSRLAYLKNYKLPVGPQKAYSVGFEYRSPEYWWFGATVNLFDDIYVGVNPLTRTQNFSNNGGVPFNDYSPELAKELLQQEKFQKYTVVNFVGGKTWKVNSYYIGFFVSINNLLNTHYKTGGFEQARNANYRELRDDKALEKPVFGNKYWFGRGTTYFLNINIRF